MQSAPTRKAPYPLRAIAVFLCCFAFLAGISPCAAAQSSKKELVLYTALTATTPQMPLWGAIHAGWGKNHQIRVEYWKTLNDLRGIILAGKGDIWVGHLEGFAQAASRGAPVTLVAVTGWKKFYFIAPSQSTATSMPALAQELKNNGKQLAVAPQDSPAISILEESARRKAPPFAIAAMPPQQLMLEMMRGTRQYALLPEPLATALTIKKPSLRIAANLEEEFARLFGGNARMPLVGIAVNTNFAKNNPELVRELVAGMLVQAEKLAKDKTAAVNILPEVVINAVGRDVITTSLARDTLHVVPANECKDEIAAFLGMVLPARAGSAPTQEIAHLLAGPFILPQGTTAPTNLVPESTLPETQGNVSTTTPDSTSRTALSTTTPESAVEGRSAGTR